MRKKNKRVDPIPKEFSSYEEAAEFRKRHYQVEVDEDVIKAIRKQAQKLGVSVDRLVNEILRRQTSNVA